MNRIAAGALIPTDFGGMVSAAGKRVLRYAPGDHAKT